MLNRKPEKLALIVALFSTLTVLLVVLTDLTLSYQRDLESGEKRLQQFSVMMAEHTARSFEAVDLLVNEIAGDLSSNRTTGMNGPTSAAGNTLPSAIRGPCRSCAT
jgi:hypothetical protein